MSFFHGRLRKGQKQRISAPTALDDERERQFVPLAQVGEKRRKEPIVPGLGCRRLSHSFPAFAILVEVGRKGELIAWDRHLNKDHHEPTYRSVTASDAKVPLS
jgi:hypothetical protein